jgi:hypothetical protein
LCHVLTDSCDGDVSKISTQLIATYHLNGHISSHDSL